VDRPHVRQVEFGRDRVQERHLLAGRCTSVWRKSGGRSAIGNPGKPAPAPISTTRIDRPPDGTIADANRPTPATADGVEEEPFRSHPLGDGGQVEPVVPLEQRSR
jgi:hypothetical protein